MNSTWESPGRSVARYTNCCTHHVDNICWTFWITHQILGLKNAPVCLLDRLEKRCTVQLPTRGLMQCKDQGNIKLDKAIECTWEMAVLITVSISTVINKRSNIDRSTWTVSVEQWTSVHSGPPRTTLNWLIQSCRRWHEARCIVLRTRSYGPPQQGRRCSTASTVSVVNCAAQVYEIKHLGLPVGRCTTC